MPNQTACRATSTGSAKAGNQGVSLITHLDLPISMKFLWDSADSLTAATV